MTKKDKKEITILSKEFAEHFYETFGSIAGSGPFIVDPLAAFLGAIGYENTMEYYTTDDGLKILVIEFEDGTQFVPAGSDLNKIKRPESEHVNFTDWMWFDQEFVNKQNKIEK